MSNPRGSLLNKPSLRELEAMAFEHFLHDERPDLAYSATILIEARDADDNILDDGMTNCMQLDGGLGFEDWNPLLISWFFYF